ncbi:MAG TPA: hypothetical protein DEO65_02645 [Bacillus bacterium]|uniref:hypothetical protein n=1 Tax=Siminovitchia fordii TaxID=254759 RepID=UPI00037A02B5|nr:hypothetical protein [Siminovitchia fordii]HBZ08768.1 hypothetical protein [Bacillus sp. (in: firmicutes)]
MLIGFELITQRAWTILPGASFSIAIVWNQAKIPSSIGKDIFYKAGMILPNKILTGTGRIHHISDETINAFEPLQSEHCHLVSCPKDPPSTLRLDITVPKSSMVDTIYQTSFIKMWKRKDSVTRDTVLYFDPHSVQNIQKNQFQIDLFYLLKK